MIFSPGNATFGISTQDTANSRGVTLTGNVTTNTKGAWVEITSALTYGVDALHISLKAGTAINTFLDVAIGANGSEVVVVSNLPFRLSTTRVFASFVRIPVRLPVGARVAARIQSSTSNGTSRFGIFGERHGVFVPVGIQKVATVGLNAGTTGVTSVDAGGSANTKGGWVQIDSGSNVAYPIKGILVANAAAAGATNYDQLLDIGWGAAASEQTLVSNIPLLSHTNSDGNSPYFLGPFWCDLPASSRLVAQLQASGSADTTNRKTGIAFVLLH